MTLTTKRLTIAGRRGLLAVVTQKSQFASEADRTIEQVSELDLFQVLAHFSSECTTIACRRSVLDSYRVCANITLP